jgi:endoglucanase
MNSWAVAAALMGAQAAPISPVQAPPGRPDAVQNCAAVSARTCVLAHSLGRGVNLGNMLEAPREGDWGVKAEPALIDLAARNFQTVRVPVRWSNHAAPTADATIDEAFARRVDEVVDRLLARGVNVILNVHHYNQLTGTPLHPREFAVEPAVLETRFLNLWRQIATRYQHRSERLVFELLNEPNTRLNGAPWNKLAAEALTVVRASNPTRAVIIGPGEWNNAKELMRLRLPRDKNLIAAVHTYEPYKFTHQGVSWRKDLLTGVRCCDARQREEVVDALELARKWNRGSGVPVHLGEFGAHSAGDVTSRANWARLVRDEAEQRGIGWAWWEMASDFSGVYSPENGGWVEPIRRALLD